MNSNRKIAWEKFTPSSSSEFNNFLRPQDDNKDESSENNTWIDEEEEEDEDHEEEESNVANFLNGMDAILINRKTKTPFGYYDIDDDFCPYNMFECWIGHTNFRITVEDFDILDKEIDGIGCLKVLSPYRFFIGIEKMFSFPAVRIQIQKDLCKNLEFDENLVNYSGDVDETINMAISKINDAIFSIRDAEKWAVYIGIDGTIESIKSSDFDYDYEYNDKLKKLKSLKSGNIITYDSL